MILGLHARAGSSGGIFQGCKGDVALLYPCAVVVKGCCGVDSHGAVWAGGIEARAGAVLMKVLTGGLDDFCDGFDVVGGVHVSRTRAGTSSPCKIV